MIDPRFEHPWSLAEDETLRAAYSSGGIHAAQAALPGRSQTAIYHRARRLGLSRRRRWTEADNNRLRVLWDLAIPLTRIAHELGRDKAAVYVHAQAMRLPLGCPEGFEHLTAAAERVGYPAKTLRRILAWAGVPVKVTLSRPVRASWRRQIVDPLDVDEAVAAWLKTEPAEAAARRLGISGDRLRDRLRKVGVPVGRGRVQRVTEEQLRAANEIARFEKRTHSAPRTA